MMNEKKKGTPGGAPIPQINGTTPGSKSQWLAQILFDMIGKYDKPIRRPKNPSVDRAFRSLIEEANKKGDCIINDGAGYYRPRRGDAFDEHCFDLYRAKELARAKALIDKLEAMTTAFYGGGTNDII